MRRIIVLLAGFITMLVLALPAVAGPFTDVPTDHWAYDAIDKLQAEGFVEGYPDGTFRGNRSFTRYEMAMVIARIWDRVDGILKDLETKIVMPGTPGMGTGDLEDDIEILYDLMDEFSEELENLGVRMDAIEGRMSSAEERISYLEKFLDTIKITGALRTRIEDIITNEYEDVLAGQAGNDPREYWGTPGMNPGEMFEFEEMALIGFEAHPSDYLDVYLTLLQVASFLNSPKGDTEYMVLDEAWAEADMMKLMGWNPNSLFGHFNLVVGRQYARFGEFGLAFDNGYMSRPGILIEAGGDNIELASFIARSEHNEKQEGLAVGRVSYGFGESRSVINPRDCFARVGFNYLGTGVGNEVGLGVDLDTELLGATYLNRLRVEFFQLQKAQMGTDVSEAWDDYENSLIAWIDLYNDGNTRVSAAYADIGLVPGFSGVDNNPFEEYDEIYNSNFREGTFDPVFYGYESGVNPFPMNFEGFGVQAEHTWWDVLNTRLTFYDGTNQMDDDYPVVIRLNIRYPLSEASDIALEYIHSGIDALTLAKLRGEFLVRF